MQERAANDYKVVGWSIIDNNPICFQVLTLKSNVWKDVGKLEYTYLYNPIGLLCNRALHWLMKDQNNKEVIVSFNLITEEITKIPLPSDPSYEATTYSLLGIIDECLCIYFDLHSPIWVMKNYNVPHSWTAFPSRHARKHNDVEDYLKNLKDYVPNTSIFDENIKYRQDLDSIGSPIFVQSLVSPHFTGRQKRKNDAHNSNTNDKVNSRLEKVLLGLRDKARKHIKQRIRNGENENTSVWFDKWCNIVPLSDYITSKDLYDVRYDHDASVASMISNGQWKWINEWKDKFAEICKIDVPILNNENDKAIWRDNNGQIKNFSIKQVWEDYKINGPKLPYKDLEGLEAKVHDANVPNDWHSLVNYLASMGKNKCIKVILKKIVFGAAVYFIWQERNRRLFTSVKRKVIDLLEAILEVIKLRLVSLRVTNSQNGMEVTKK
ncbi:hypothetical protein Tco_1577415 [Tanacetum coccineum]